MAGELTSSGFTSDQELLIQNKLLSRANLKLVCASICEKVSQPKGAGKTAYFVRYKRMNVPVASLSEGVDPSNSSFTLEQVTVTLDQWGDVLTLTDVAQLTTKHPLMQQAIELLSDNAQRVMDREVQIVWLAGTNVMYPGTATSRPTVASSDKISDTVIHKAIVTLSDAGAMPRGSSMSDAKGGAASGDIRGGKHFVGIAGPQVIHEIQTLTNFVAVAQYGNAKALYNAEVGSWLGVKWVETNFIPKFTTLGNTTTAVASGASGGITGLVVSVVNGASGALSNSTTYYWKVTRKDLTRGFEEAISIEHTTATGAADDAFTFALPSTAGYVYNVYFGSSTGDANLKLAAENQAAGTTVTVNDVPSSSTTAPAATAAATETARTIHPVYIHGEESCKWVGLQNLEVIQSGDQATTHNPLKLRRTIGYKFMGKAVIVNQSNMIRLEVASTF